MIITSIALPKLSNYGLDLIANRIDGEAKLVAINWVDNVELDNHQFTLGELASERIESFHWQVVEKIQEQQKQQRLCHSYNIDKNDVHFIEQNSLSEDEQVQALLLTTIEQLNQYFNGRRQRFDLPLDLSPGTKFQQKVWHALAQIPYGETISYAKLAQNIGQPTAYRAVANANGKNPFSIIIPCHRVIASDGGLGGYTGGIDKKQLLLSIESNHSG